MNEVVLILIGIYLAVVSLCGLLLVLRDKSNSRRKGKPRVPERVLFFTGIIGGAVVMFVAMLLIRHKTRKPKFMFGFPFVILVHIGAAYGVYTLFM
ncbi:MAG: DUF1294 domain-containing protein [Oscillospiraceae bacterium]|nr:DUF1294 domain-containing protein [Oscillospiraceae bacterium]